MKKKLQVFISSTYTDLIEERQAAVEAILSSRHIPAGMELFTAGDESQLNVIKRWIDESDIYLLILGGRYGSIEPQTGKSYIQLEYEYAIKTKKPFFSIVIKENAIDEKVKKIDKNVLELDNPQKYKEFKKIVTSKLCSFFEDSKDIKIAVSNKMSEYERQDNISGWISGRDVKNSEKYADEILKLIGENKKYKEKIADLEKKIEMKKDSSPKTVALFKDRIENRVSRVLELIGADLQSTLLAEKVIWYDDYNTGNPEENDNTEDQYNEDEDTDNSYEIKIEKGFSYYFVYKENSTADIDYLIMTQIDSVPNKSIEGIIADIRLMIESHKNVDKTMTFKYVIASLQIDEELEKRCKEFFELALQKANVDNKALFKFEIWNDKNLSLLEEELGLKL